MDNFEGNNANVYTCEDSKDRLIRIPDNETPFLIRHTIDFLC